MSELVRAVQLFKAEWPRARALWKTTDPRLYAVTPADPVERIMEVMTSAFGALVRAIGHQQVSIYAGRAIIGRLVAACGDAMDPETVLRLSDEEFRSVGLSRQKVAYIRAIAHAAITGGLSGIDSASEEEAAQRLVQLPGVGIWTAQMFCIFHLERPDVFSGGDLGLREGIKILDDLEAQPSARAAEERALVWRPYRSVAAISLWDLVRRTRLGLQPPRS